MGGARQESVAMPARLPHSRGRRGRRSDFHFTDFPRPASGEWIRA